MIEHRQRPAICQYTHHKSFPPKRQNFSSNQSALTKSHDHLPPQHWAVILWLRGHNAFLASQRKSLQEGQHPSHCGWAPAEPGILPISHTTLLDLEKSHPFRNTHVLWLTIWCFTRTLVTYNCLLRFTKKFFSHFNVNGKSISFFTYDVLTSLLQLNDFNFNHSDSQLHRFRTPCFLLREGNVAPMSDYL